MLEEFIELVFSCILSTLAGIFLGAKAQEELQSIGTYLKQVLQLAPTISFVISIISFAISIYITRLSMIFNSGILSSQVIQSLMTAINPQVLNITLNHIIFDTIINFSCIVVISLLLRLSYVLNSILGFNSDFNAPYL